MSTNLSEIRARFLDLAAQAAENHWREISGSSNPEATLEAWANGDDIDSLTADQPADLPLTRDEAVLAKVRDGASAGDIASFHEVLSDEKQAFQRFATKALEGYGSLTMAEILKAERDFARSEDPMFTDSQARQKVLADQSEADEIDTYGSATDRR
jgi:hypothetical protein